MKISELKGRLANILEVPEDPIRVVMRRVRARDFPSQDPSILRDILARAFTLERIWTEFKEVLEREGRGLDKECTPSELDFLSTLTKKAFSQIRVSRHSGLKEKTQKDKERFLEAIAILKRDLFH